MSTLLLICPACRKVNDASSWTMQSVVRCPKCEAVLKGVAEPEIEAQELTPVDGAPRLTTVGSLPPETVKAIFKAEGMSSEIAAHFKVSVKQVNKIKMGLLYHRITHPAERRAMDNEARRLRREEARLNNSAPPKQRKTFTHLSHEAVLEIYAAKGSLKSLAEKYGCTTSSVSAIRGGRNHSELTGHQASRVKRKRAP